MAKAKQQTLPDVELVGSKSLQEKAEVLADVRKKRMKLQGDEADAQLLLVEAMRKEKIPAFQLEDGRTVELVQGAEKVKIRTPKDDEGDAEE